MPKQGRTRCIAIPPAVFWLMLLAAVVAAHGRSAADEGTAPRLDRQGDPIPGGAVVRLGTTRYRGTGQEIAPLFTAGDQTFVTLAQNRRIALLEAATGKTVREFDLGGQNVTNACLSQDRRTLFFLGNGFDEDKMQSFQSVRHLDLANGELLKTIRFDERSGGGKLVAMPDGINLLTSSGDGMLRFWDVSKGDEVLHKKFDRRIDSLAVSPDGQLLAVGTSQDLFLWEWAVGKDPVKIPIGWRVVSLAFSPDGLILAEGPDYRGEITLRDVPSRRVLRTLSDAKKNPMHVSSLGFTADGRSLVSSNSIGIRGIEHRIHVWDVTTGKIRSQFGTDERQLSRVAVSGDGKWLAASGSSSSAVSVWNLQTGKLMADEIAGHDGEIPTVHLSRDGKTAVTAGGDGTVRVWDAVTGTQSRLVRHGYWVRGCALSGDDRLIVSSSLDDTVRLWNQATGREIFRLPGHGRLGGVRAVAFSPDGNQFASWGDDLYLRVWDTRTGKALSERRPHPPEFKVPETEDEADREDVGMGFRVDQAVFSRDATRLALSQSTSIWLFDVASGDLQVKLQHEDGALMSLDISPDGKRFVTSAWGKPVQTVLADGRIRFSQGIDNVARVRDIATGATLLEIPLPDGGAGPAAFSNDGALLAVAGRTPESTIQIFDMRTDEECATLETIPAGARAICFSGDNRRLACAFNDGTALIWDLKLPRKAQ